MKKFVKNPLDFFIGLGFAVLSIVLISVDVTNGAEAMMANMQSFANSPLTKPGIYVNFFAWVLLALAALLILRSLNLNIKFLRRDETAAAPKVRVNTASVVSIIALLIYMVVMPKIGFYISSTILCAVVSFSFRLKEKPVDMKDKKAVFKAVGLAVVYSAVMVAVLQFIFTKFFNVIFP